MGQRFAALRGYKIQKMRYCEDMFGTMREKIKDQSFVPDCKMLFEPNDKLRHYGRELKRLDGREPQRRRGEFLRRYIRHH
jgi:hypothetical protein